MEKIGYPSSAMHKDYRSKSTNYSGEKKCSLVLKNIEKSGFKMGQNCKRPSCQKYITVSKKNSRQSFPKN